MNLISKLIQIQTLRTLWSISANPRPSSSQAHLTWTLSGTNQSSTTTRELISTSPKHISLVDSPLEIQMWFIQQQMKLGTALPATSAWFSNVSGTFCNNCSEFIVPGHSCSLPNDPINGHKNCTEDAHAVQCTLACNDGFAFAFRPTGDFTCQTSGPGSWIPPAGVTAFPDCSVTTLSSVVSIPTKMNVGVVSERKRKKEKSLCDDTFFLKQVEDHVRQKVLGRLQEVCGDSLYCDVTELEAICGDVLSQRQVWTNEVFRKRRSVQTEKELTSSVLIEGDGKQMIEIVFKLVGESYNLKHLMVAHPQESIEMRSQGKQISSVSLRRWTLCRRRWKNLLQAAVSVSCWEDNCSKWKEFRFFRPSIFVKVEPFLKTICVVSYQK